MTDLRRFSIAAAACCAVLVAPSAARAASCTAYPLEVLPNETTTEVPSNTKVWLFGQTLEWAYQTDALANCDVLPRLLDAEGNEVASTPRVLSSAYVLVPDTLLEVGETYTTELGCLGIHAAESFEFTVTADEDLVVPEQPDIELGETNRYAYEGFVSYSVDVEGTFEHMLLLDVGLTSTLDPEALTGNVSLMAGHTNFVVGHSCGTTWADAGPGASTEVAFSSFDLAGNFSGWTEPDLVEIEDEEESQGCTVGSPTSASLLGMMLLGFVRRRVSRLRSVR